MDVEGGARGADALGAEGGGGSGGVGDGAVDEGEQGKAQDVVGFVEEDFEFGADGGFAPG